MSNPLFSKALIAVILLSASAFAQDTTKRAPLKPKTYVKQVVPKPAATYPAKTPGTYTAKKFVPVPKTTVTHAPAPAAGTIVQPQAIATAPTDRSINGQYQYLLTKLYGYQRPMLAAFHKSIMDTIMAERKKIKPLVTNVATLTDTVKELHKQLGAQQVSLNQSQSKVDNISLLGIDMPKSSYNMLMWGLVVVFGVIAAFVIFRSGSYSREAKYRIKLYDDLDEEYKGYKAKSNEKEKKLARELQTARNKIEEITGNPY